MNAKEKAKSRHSTLTYMEDRCIAENRQPTAEERQILAEVAAELDEIGQSALISEWFTQSQGRQTAPGGGPIGDGPGSYRPTGPGAAPGGPAVSGLYKDMFYPGQPNARLDDSGFKPGEFFDVLRSGRYDPRLYRNTFIETGVPSEGSAAVPEITTAQWLDSAYHQEVCRPRCQPWPMTSQTQKIPGWDFKDQTGGVQFGGFEMVMLPENTDADIQTGKLLSIELVARTGGIYSEIGNEMAADALSFESQLSTALVSSIAYGLDKFFLRGTGVGQPLGVLNATSLITVDKEAMQAADTIVYENIVNMWSRMYDVGKTRCVWVCNPSVLPQLLTMGITLGVGGAPVYLPAGGAAGAPNDTLFGRPLLYSPVLSVLGDLGDITLIDFSAYAYGMRAGLVLQKSQHVGFMRRTEVWRTLLRFDGMPTWSSVLSPEHGATQSWAVTLAAR
jgi:HK97 family phage major capsid protein